MKIQKKSQHQFRALFWKNYSLQTRQVGTNLCQTVTPLICLMFVYLIKEIAFDKYQGVQFKFDFPFLFNVPAIYNAYPSLLNLTCLQWYNYEFAKEMPEEDKHFVGWNTGIQGENMSHGLLSHVVGKPGCMYMQNNTEKLVTVPFFQKPKDTINEDIYKQVLYLNTMPFKRGNDIENLYLIPDGAVTFNKASEQGINVTLQVNDLRLHEYHRGNGVTKIKYQNYLNPNKTQQMLFVAEGQLSIIDLVTRAYLHYLNPDVWLISGVQYMPIDGDDVSIILKAINVTGATLYPFALSLLLPVFLYAIVLEKEERLLQMMKMNGMKMSDYWIVTFIFNGLMTVLTFGLFILVGYYIIDLAFFTQTNQTLLVFDQNLQNKFLIFFGWGLSQISLSIFFQVFINKAKVATIIGYLLSVWISVLAITINMVVYPDPYEIPIYLQMVPPVAFSRLVYVLSMCKDSQQLQECSQSSCIKEVWPLSQELTGCMASLYLGFFIFGGLGLYLHDIVPQDYGVQKQCALFKKKESAEVQEFSNEQINISVHEAQEDEDSRMERQMVYDTTPQEMKEYPLFCRDLCKVYEEQGGRARNIAVKSMCLKVEAGEIFGLLGPNGAGKTTLISMLTGLYPCTSGTANVGGYNITSELSKVQMNLGVCPQFDLLWPELTIEEHLLFYARLKGVPRQLEKARVHQSMKEVKLLPFCNYQTMNLSGGMKRRLSIAIALVGDPAILFLDEPSTGLDPENRRQLWDILVESKGKRAMVLTTHSMEEADVLCSRIGIISQGVLRCIGPQVRLKSLYGGGYHLYITCYKDRYLQAKNKDEKPATFYHQEVLNFISSILPQAEIVQQFNGNFVFQIEQKGIIISKIFALIENQKEELRIEDWGISQSSLEDVFMRIVTTT